MDSSLILLDDPAPMVRRITLNRPEKRNALNATLRREILTATREADRAGGVAVVERAGERDDADLHGAALTTERRVLTTS